jgi:hypothetical protein
LFFSLPESGSSATRFGLMRLTLPVNGLISAAIVSMNVSTIAVTVLTIVWTIVAIALMIASITKVIVLTLAWTALPRALKMRGVIGCQIDWTTRAIA